jgi:hypothetical protein
MLDLLKGVMQRQTIPRQKRADGTPAIAGNPATTGAEGITGADET